MRGSIRTARGFLSRVVAGSADSRVIGQHELPPVGRHAVRGGGRQRVEAVH